MFISNERFTTSTSALKKYFSDVNKLKRLSIDEETELALIISKGGVDADLAINKLVESNLKFVVSVAKMYHGFRDDPSKLEDLINEGNYGLIEAAKVFKAETGFKFISYAVWHIRSRIVAYLSNHMRQIRFPQNISISIRKMNHITNDLTQKLGREPHKEEIFEAYNRETRDNSKYSSISYLDHAVRMGNHPVSLESPVGDSEDGFNLIDTIDGTIVTSDRDVNRKSTSRILMYFVNRLRGRERDAVISRHGLDGTDPQSFDEISRRWDVGAESIRLNYNRALRRLRMNMREKDIKLDDLL